MTDTTSAHTTQARVFTVPPGKPFLDVLAAALINGALGHPHDTSRDPLALTDITLLLPTRRATRALQDAFLKHTGQSAVLMPRIRPIAEGEDDLTLLSGLAGLTTLTPDDAEANPAISELERRLVLTQLVMRWSQAMRAAAQPHDGAILPYAAAGSDTPAQAAHLAAELARLMDMVETEGASLADLATLVPETFSEHWQKTIQFLDILTGFWPAHLAERGMSAPVAQRNQTLLAEARRLIDSPPKGPVIVAGVTGSIPATAELMRAVTALPNGAIVLPNLDLALDPAGFEAIRPAAPSSPAEIGHPEHPQHGLKLLLDRLGIRREDVEVLPGAESDADMRERFAFFSQAMRPAATTARWHDYAEKVDRDALTRALGGVNLIDAPSAQDEAEAVALIMREALETPGQTAALVSPDRLLARRVATRLESWGIRVDDSAGRPFAKTVPGAFLDLVIETVHRSFAPAELTALLKHPLTRLGLGAFEVRRAGRALEIAAFRTDYFGSGLDGAEAALEEAQQDVGTRERRERAVQRLWDDDWAGARDLVARLKTAFAPLVTLYQGHAPHRLSELAAAHIAVAEALAQLPDSGDAKPDEDAATSPLYQGEAGTAASLLFNGLIDTSLPALDIAAQDYADLYRSLIANENVRPRVPVHPRLLIWGPFEARLQQPDIVILGSLNDGKWPEAADPGAWLNRPMRKALGLPQPEEKIGHAAHDFTSLLGARHIYLTRAEKIDGVPTVPSRWLMRIVALLDGMDMREAIRMDRPWLGWARTRDHVAQRRTISAPRPAPPVAMRPRRLSVSGVEQWIANPYAIFATRILGLDSLPELGCLPDASLKGSIVHSALAAFARRYPETLPRDIEAELAAIARQQLAPYLSNPRIRAFWLPRFERFARWFAETEPQRRANGGKVLAEIDGTLVIDAPAGPFMLTARADRIDATPTGLVITDYKTGQVPSNQNVEAGLAPQLPLEAAIAIAGGFTGLDRQRVAALHYIRSTGGSPPGEEHAVGADDIGTLAATQLEGLAALVARYDDAAMPYAAVRRPGFNYQYDDFAQLARVAEWSGQPEADGEA